MEPLSSLLAKPALEVLGEPLLASGWRLLAGARCESITVNTHRHPDQVAAAARQMDPEGRLLQLSYEERLLGGAGGVAAVRFAGTNEPFLVANADIWANLDLRTLRRINSHDAIHLALLPHPDPNRWRSVVLDASGRVDDILEPGVIDPRPRYLFSGVQRLGGMVTDGLPDPPCEWAEVWQERQAAGKLFGLIVQGRWHEGGDPEAYRRLVLSLLPGQHSWVHPGARVAGSAVLLHCAVGKGCLVAAGVQLTSSVLTAGARANSGTCLAECVVAGRVTLEAVVAQGQLILPDRHVPLPMSGLPGQN